MEILRVVWLSLLSIVVLFILTKIMGNRQMSQLSLFDYIIGITVGSIAAELATDLEDCIQPLTAMIVYGLVAAFISYINCKSVLLRRFISGKPMILYENGKLYAKNLEKSRLDLGEFLTQCRNSGYFDLKNIHAAVLESNGKVSFLPTAQQRPATPADLNLSPPQEQLVSDVIIDGNIMKENLNATGNNETWLREQLQTQGVENISEVFLATCDGGNTLSIYRKINEKMDKDIFS